MVRLTIEFNEFDLTKFNSDILDIIKVDDNYIRNKAILLDPTIDKIFKLIDKYYDKNLQCKFKLKFKCNIEFIKGFLLYLERFRDHFGDDYPNIDSMGKYIHIINNNILLKINDKFNIYCTNLPNIDYTGKPFKKNGKLCLSSAHVDIKKYIDNIFIGISNAYRAHYLHQRKTKKIQKIKHDEKLFYFNNEAEGENQYKYICKTTPNKYNGMMFAYYFSIWWSENMENNPKYSIGRHIDNDDRVKYLNECDIFDLPTVFHNSGKIYKHKLKCKNILIKLPPNYFAHKLIKDKIIKIYNKQKIIKIIYVIISLLNQNNLRYNINIVNKILFYYQ